MAMDVHPMLKMKIKIKDHHHMVMATVTDLHSLVMDLHLTLIKIKDHHPMVMATVMDPHLATIDATTTNACSPAMDSWPMSTQLFIPSAPGLFLNTTTNQNQTSPEIHTVKIQFNWTTLFCSADFSSP